MSRHTRLSRLFAATTVTVALASAAPAAQAMPIDNAGPASPIPVQILRTEADAGLDVRDVGIGAVGMLALVLVGFGGAHAVTAPRRGRARAHS